MATTRLSSPPPRMSTRRLPSSSSITPVHRKRCRASQALTTRLWRTVLLPSWCMISLPSINLRLKSATLLNRPNLTKISTILPSRSPRDACSSTVLAPANSPKNRTPPSQHSNHLNLAVILKSQRPPPCSPPQMDPTRKASVSTSTATRKQESN